jgi:Fe-S cluster biogenesis protein NfuA
VSRGLTDRRTVHYTAVIDKAKTAQIIMNGACSGLVSCSHVDMTLVRESILRLNLKTLKLM